MITFSALLLCSSVMAAWLNELNHLTYTLGKSYWLRDDRTVLEEAHDECFLLKFIRMNEKETLSLMEILNYFGHVKHYNKNIAYYCINDNVSSMLLASLKPIDSYEPMITLQRQSTEQSPWQINKEALARCRYRGAGVTIYVVDSLIDVNHPSIVSRAMMAETFLGENQESDYEHGTMVASLAAGNITGLATKANIVGLEVLDKTGDTTTFQIVQALHWIREHATMPAVVNLSVGGTKSRFMDEAIMQLIEVGIPVVVAAGNDDTNADLTSPGDINEAIVVGAVNSNGKKAAFSNYGETVDVYAPGEDVLVARPLSKTYATGSGTSFSAPLVAGLVALMLEKSPSMKPHEIERQVTLAVKSKKPSEFGSLLKLAKEQISLNSSSKQTFSFSLLIPMVILSFI